MTTICTWGKPLPEVGRAEINPDTTGVFRDQWGEVWVDLSFTPREPTDQEYNVIVPQFVQEFAIEHPEIEVRYVEAMRGSPHQMRIQFISHTNPITFAMAAAFLLAVLGLVLSKIIYIAIAAAVVMAGYALYKRLKPPVYQCPICGKTYEEYETLVAHMESEHPGASIPDKPSVLPDWVFPVLVAGVLVAVVAIAAPPLIRRVKGSAK